MNDITFTSRFSPVIKQDFAKKLSAFGKECLVDSPWRIESAKVGKTYIQWEWKIVLYVLLQTVRRHY